MEPLSSFIFLLASLNIFLIKYFFIPQDGLTALIWAAHDGKMRTAALLLDRGADIEAKDDVRIMLPSSFLRK